MNYRGKMRWVSVLAMGIMASWHVLIVTAQPATTLSTGEILGWVPDQNNRCHGYFEETPINYPFSIAARSRKSPLSVNADHTHYAAKGTTLLQGHVTVTQPNRQVLSDKAYLIRNPQTRKVNVIHALGDVRLREPGGLVQGSEATVTLANKTWDMKQPTYRLVMDNHYQPHIVNAKTPYGVYDISGWGHAKEAYKDTQGDIVIHQGTFSTCVPDHADWHLRASTITLNRQSGRGSSFNNVLYVKNIPVFYLPYANFPIDARRKTGLLYPTAGFSSEDGLDVALPFYWNIAPNYDATITPHMNQHRGARLDGLFRYLLASPDSEGNVSAVWFPHDRHFANFKKDAAKDYSSAIPANKDNLATLAKANDSRGFFHLDNRTQFNSHWQTNMVFNHTTDDYLPEAISVDADSASDKQLLQQAKLNYADQHWHALANVQAYQTLHPLNQASVANSYARLPQLALRADYPDSFAGTHVSFNTDFTYFDIQRNPGQSIHPPTGIRYQLNPQISLPLHWKKSAYFTPRVQLDMVTYQLQHTDTLGKHPTRTLPIIDVDTGLVFERYVAAYKQTLEPRLFYLYVPFRNQNTTPIFDTGIRTFNVSQLTATNRFSGFDRLGDANQLAFLLTSRLLSADSGDEKLAATVGQIVYFRDRKVQLCGGENRNCDTLQTDARRSDGTSDVDTLSPIVGAVDYHVTDDVLLQVSSAWSPIHNEFNNTTVSASYQPDPKHVINLGYSFLRQGDIYPTPVGTASLPLENRRNNLSQLNMASAWPIWGNWSAVGRFNYNLSHRYAQDYFYGVQYDSCCWALRVIGSHYMSYFDERANPQFKQVYYIQFLFKGIGSVGTSNPNRILHAGLPGYGDPFRRQLI